MPEISRFFGMVVTIYLEEDGQHHLPHFHVRYQRHRASYGIFPVTQLAGALPIRQQRLIEAWTEIHQEELLRAWEVVQRGGKPMKIKGLE